VAKVGGVGRAALRDGAAASVMQERSSMVVGGQGYMDPQYVRTAGSYGPTSDVYSLGLVMLQLLTGKPLFGGNTEDGGEGACWRNLLPPRITSAWGRVPTVARSLAGAPDRHWHCHAAPADDDLVWLVEQALEQDSGQRGGQGLDAHAGTWPATEAAAFARLALRCVEFQRKRRPSLQEQVLPELQRLQAAAQVLAAAAAAPAPAAQAAPAEPEEPPAYLCCPITQALMTDPVQAADGQDVPARRHRAVAGQPGRARQVAHHKPAAAAHPAEPQLRHQGRRGGLAGAARRRGLLMPVGLAAWRRDAAVVCAVGCDHDAGQMQHEPF
jgi:hypothetical protein